MEGMYFFGEYARWNLGFQNPNVAGAFVAMLIAFLTPLTTALPRHKKYRILFLLALAGEIFLWFVMAKTYSRGAFVSTSVCLLACNLLFIFCKYNRLNVLSILSVKVVAIFLIVLLTGFSSRISPDYIKDDGSIGARTTLWQGGLKMIAQSPIRGWGVNKSGEEYINWFQPIGDEREYAGMVNSFLYIGVERGLPILFIAVLPFVFLITICFVSSLKKFILPLCGALGLLSYMISNSFSTLWIFEPLWWIVGIFVVLTIFVFWNCTLRFVAKCAVFAFFFSFAICSSLYILGRILDEGNISNNTKYIRIGFLDNSEPKNQIAIFPDENILGKYYGKKIRNAVFPIQPNVVIDVFRSDFTAALNQSYSTIILCGKSASLLNKADPMRRKVILINPIGQPLRLSRNIDFAYLSIFDAYNQNPKWIRFFKNNKIPFKYIEYSAQEISHESLIDILKNM